MADVFMGYFVERGAPTVRSSIELLAVLVCSSCLYLAGMVLNDIFDREIDARERPHRPIPSGRVPLARAKALATVLIVAGLLASLVAGYDVGIQPLLVALMLLTAIFLYDGWAKNTAIGPIVMGSCRFFNVLLWAGVHSPDLKGVFTSHITMIAAAIGIYVAGVTWFAKKEAEQSSRGGLILGQSVLNLGLILIAAWMTPQLWSVWQSIWPSGLPIGDGWRPLVMLGVIAVVVNRRALAAMSDPRPQMVQSAVRIMLLSIITIDATLIYATLGTLGIPIAAAVVALLVPSFVLGKWMTMT
jgi:4-hydroxybenzoate polyprenyltransferase